MRLLVVEDDRALADQLRAALREAGYAVDLAHDGEEAEFAGETVAYDLAVLDLGLPRRDGIAVLRAWRRAGRDHPVLILTARDAWADKVAGFRAGADDYLVKPFRMEEVVLRARALVRRGKGRGEALLRCGPLELDTLTGAVAKDGLPLRLTAFERRVLAYLLHAGGRVVSRTELSEHVYEEEDGDRDFNAMEVIVSRLRRKIAPARVETVRGAGWRLAAPGDDGAGPGTP